VDRRELLSESRIHKVSVARQEAAFRLMTELDLGYMEVGRKLGRDHGTIFKAIRQYLKEHPKAAAVLDDARLRQQQQKADLWENAKALSRKGLSAKQIAERLRISPGHAQRAAREALQAKSIEGFPNYPASIPERRAA
jgi:DNA-directed RNA polymerase specialized sigma24 family protein